MLCSASSCCILFLAVALVELLDAAACLYVTLTTREERMALGADIDAKLRLRGTCLERVTATANYRSFIVLRMNTLLHIYTPHFPPRSGEWIQAHYAQAWFRPSSPSSGESQSIFGLETDVTTSITGLLYHRAHALARKQRENPLEKNSPIEDNVVYRGNTSF